MRMAVCLSGQPRVIKYTLHNTRHFFEGTGYSVDYFCHSWDYNTYKRKSLDPDITGQPVWWEGEELVDRSEILECFKILNPKKFIIHSKDDLRWHFPWNSMFYSIMYANHLKRQYEFENNFRYDIVVKTRYDEVYDPRAHFSIDGHFNPENYLDIFVCHKNRMEFEYNRINSSDAFFYGSSMSMDLICDVFRDTLRLYKEDRYDDYECLGPGVRMQNLCEQRNLNLVSSYVPETVYRKECIPMDPMTNYEEIKDFNISLYRVLTVTPELKS